MQVAQLLSTIQVMGSLASTESLDRQARELANNILIKVLEIAQKETTEMHQQLVGRISLID